MNKGEIKTRFINDIVTGKYSLNEVNQRISEYELKYGSDFFANYEVDKKEKPWDMAYLKELELKSITGMCSKQFVLHLAEVSEYVHKNQKKKSNSKKAIIATAAAVAIIGVIVVIIVIK